MELRREHVSRMIMPLREGGSLPALVEADDEFKYALKFRGSGHGSKALIAELLGGELARAIGLKVPELVFLDVDEAFGRSESDAEVQDLLKQSRGLNLGLHFLSGALNVDPYANPIDDMLASQIVWLDAFITNVDRTIKNTNMLLWNKEVWLIDHGASFYFHHSWDNPEKAALKKFPYIKDHALLRKATQIEAVDTDSKKLLTNNIIDGIIDLIPEEWLNWDGSELSPSQIKEAYRVFINTRLANSQIFLQDVIDARKNTL